MLHRNSRFYWSIAVIALFALEGWAAPVPKEKTEPKAEDEVTVEPVKADFLGARKFRTQSTNNLKQIALAVHNFASASKSGVEIPQNIVDKNGKSLLSWRVQLLPYIEQANLYQQFKLDEPWDSANNLKLLEMLPKVYDCPRVKVSKKGYTIYQGFEGNGAIFGSKFTIANIPDGTSNTILCVESSKAVPWTKPVDMPFDPKKDLPDFGKAYDNKPICALCDGSVRILDLKKTSATTLKNAICGNDGNPLGTDW